MIEGRCRVREHLRNAQSNHCDGVRPITGGDWIRLSPKFTRSQTSVDSVADLQSMFEDVVIPSYEGILGEPEHDEAVGVNAGIRGFSFDLLSGFGQYVSAVAVRQEHVVGEN